MLPKGLVPVVETTAGYFSRFEASIFISFTHTHTHKASELFDYSPAFLENFGEG